MKKRIIHPGSYKTLFTRYIFSQLQESEEKKEGEDEEGEKKDDTIVYADLDKSAMSEGKTWDFQHFGLWNQIFLQVPDQA